ncbi:MAG: TRM11 family SAM-dependent methyltransferase [Ignavibacterium sp.]|uniref:TRM11 family SAM-dependent methyltransferase n=1 Tax=Ignavibacterium sp. TaxID=2651167 RepID=UPI00404AD187
MKIDLTQIADQSFKSSHQKLKEFFNSVLKRVTNNQSDSTVWVVFQKTEAELKRKILIEDIRQITEAYTFDRAKYYVNRLIKSITEVKQSKINDLNLNRWKEYEDIITDSLWIFNKRDNSGAHNASYWGNFIPQIPNQLIKRYTKKGDWVLDPFAGSGTSLIECRRLGRNAIGIDLSQKAAEISKDNLSKEKNPYNVITEIINDDSSTIDLKNHLNRFHIKHFQLIIMHPPYWDIIKFSDEKNDLSNAKSVKEFLKMFTDVLINTSAHLEKKRYLAVVIGDKYSDGEWIPLGFLTMQEVLKHNFKLKSIIVKNFEDTTAKRNQKELWRYRALVGGFYIFKHEYIFLFQKK